MQHTYRTSLVRDISAVVAAAIFVVDEDHPQKEADGAHSDVAPPPPPQETVLRITRFHPSKLRTG